MTSVVVMRALLYQNYYNCRVDNRGIDDRSIDNRGVDDRGVDDCGFDDYGVDDRVLSPDCGRTTAYLIHIKIMKYG